MHKELADDVYSAIELRPQAVSFDIYGRCQSAKSKKRETVRTFLDC
jgi:hypothetical protein